MDVHSGHVRFAIALNHAQKLPAVALVDAGVIGDQLGRGDALGPEVLHSHVQ